MAAVRSVGGGVGVHSESTQMSRACLLTQVQQTCTVSTGIGSPGKADAADAKEGRQEVVAEEDEAGCTPSGGSSPPASSDRSTHANATRTICLHGAPHRRWCACSACMAMVMVVSRRVASWAVELRLQQPAARAAQVGHEETRRTRHAQEKCGGGGWEEEWEPTTDGRKTTGRTEDGQDGASAAPLRALGPEGRRLRACTVVSLTQRDPARVGGRHRDVLPLVPPRVVSVSSCVCGWRQTDGRWSGGGRSTSPRLAAAR